MPSLSARWYEAFQGSLLAYSYAELVNRLLEVTLGRVHSRAPFEVEIGFDLKVKVWASPRLQLQDDAAPETRDAIARLQRDLRHRDRAIGRLAGVIAREQAPYLSSRRGRPRTLDLDQLAAAAGLSRDDAEAALVNKRVLHPRGLCTLARLVDPDGAAGLAVGHRRGPGDPSGDAAASLLLG